MEHLCCKVYQAMKENPDQVEVQVQTQKKVKLKDKIFSSSDSKS